MPHVSQPENPTTHENLMPHTESWEHKTKNTKNGAHLHKNAHTNQTPESKIKFEPNKTQPKDLMRMVRANQQENLAYREKTTSKQKFPLASPDATEINHQVRV